MDISIDRNETIKAIRKALRDRSGKAWSVRGDTGTAWGWITISCPPSRAADQFGDMTEADAAELGELLGLGGPAYRSGVTIPASSAHRREYLDRAAGRRPSVKASPYWD